MAEDRTPRLTDSPRKTTYLDVTRKLSRTGDDSFDADEYANAYYNFQDRRGSSQSISRYNSCPQLAEADAEIAESYERTVDDIDTNKSAIDREMHCVVVQGPSPLFRRRSYLENGEVSETPTPPSTPKSRRSIISSRDSLLSSPDKTFVSSPLASPRLLLRKQLVQSALSRDSSIDSLNDKVTVDCSKKLPLSRDNLNKFDEIKANETETTCSGKDVIRKQGSVRIKRASGQPDGVESVNKCETWLQTLHIAQHDKVKSRSHIQLPPI
ncbi:uncharacterized protein LOC128212129 [Mya arenaria]|uniref:uncharacterized protein LOC128212129 n=1 Tax=Mya arenaria TaxID=6604 RepID=UPI0022DEC2BC|nr:uncharacterized protein LOC128212129 [Mya arenaria]XP_052773373.1 uncharacterized protein LOC128212129 [Mya arenaria]XP_052773374.1 uncharacterized protein LOC128212129 [Mya arenaria]XP_052773376.1 uncharacterized protein LOC128212129 [Mya arenaria]